METPSTSSNMSDAELAVLLAREAGAELLALREAFDAGDSFGALDETTGDAAADADAAKAQADELRKRGDALAHALIAARLAEHRPDDALLSEEGKDDESRLAAQRVWIVDPLDGTWEYGQGRADFGVHIVLWDAAKQQLLAGCVELPAQGLTRSVTEQVIDVDVVRSDRPIRIVASRTRPPAALPQIVDRLAVILNEEGVTDAGVEIVDVGSVGAKVNEILAGRADAYVHDTGFYEWDVAAPYCVAEYHGLVASHLDGTPVTFNHMPPYVTDLLVSRPWLAPSLRRAIAEVAAQSVDTGTVDSGTLSS